MLHFLQPIWLFAAGAVLIPVIIHLWNIKKGKLLKVGSTLLMSAASRKSASSLRISQWLLLLLRCLLIIILSFLLAGPQWRTETKTPAKGWVLIEQQNAPAILNQFGGGIDSLKEMGFETRQFAPGFEPYHEEDTAIVATDQGLQHDSYWSLITQLDSRLPAGFPVYLFTGDKLVDLAITNADTSQIVNYANTTPGFLMPRPQVSVNLRWETISAPTTDDTTIVNYTKRAGGGTGTTRMRSGENGSYFVKTTAASIPGTDTVTNRITIFYDQQYTDDARYLEAALNAVATFGKYNIEITTSRDAAGIPSSQTWLFWLSDQEPAAVKAQHLFRYMPGKAESQRSWVRYADGPVQESAVANYMVIRNAGAENFITIWQDGYGHPILTSDKNSSVFRFYSRFSPVWSDMTWHPSFPQIILNLIFNDNPEKLYTSDQRRFTRAESMPVQTKRTRKENKAAFAVVDLNKLCWLLAFLIFSIERFLSLKNQNQVRV